MLLLDGRKLRDLIRERLRNEIVGFLTENKANKIASVPQLAIVQVGDLSESNAYINQKKIFAQKIGAKVLHKVFPNNISEKSLVGEINKLNKNKKIHGIIVQLPIPANLGKQKIIDTINPEKDVDGLTAVNVKRLWCKDVKAIVPATALGVVTLLKHYKIPIDGKKVVIVGRSTLVGKPLALVFLNENATVTICHRHTKNLKEETKLADILIIAAGKTGLITDKFVKKGQVIVDVGINLKAGHLVGDVDFEKVKSIAKAISPVPGGVGPMTVASLFENLVRVWKNNG